MRWEKMKSKVAARVMRTIPHLPNGLVIFGYNRLRKGISSKVIEEHYQHNTVKLKAFVEPDAYIENQHTPKWDEIMYGVNPFSKENCHASYNVCGVIGVFNCLISLGEHVDYLSMARLIRIFEQKGAAMGGVLGTTPRSVSSFFKKRGYKVKLLTSSDSKKIDDFGKEHDSYIVMVMNNKKSLEDYMHIAHISVDDEGLRRNYHVHNGGGTSVYTADSLSRAIGGMNKKGSNKQNKALMILGIDKD